MKKKSDKKKRLTFYLKDSLVCPSCQKTFRKEELHQSGGRIISGDLNDELHRNFLPSPKFGSVYPLIYTIPVCPFCLYASFSQDFLIVPKHPKILHEINMQKDVRRKEVERLFPELNFQKERTLKEGIASYLLALFVYDLFPYQLSPVFKQSLCSLRAGWLCKDLHKVYPKENYNYLALFFLHKARYLYIKTVEYEQNKKQPLLPSFFMGPDVDKNYGFDGIVYLAALLEYKYGNKENMKKRLEKIKKIKFMTAKLFGLGKSSKVRPSAILDKVHDLHDYLSKEITELEVSVSDD